MERLPPTQAALHQYILTTSLSGRSYMRTIAGAFTIIAESRRLGFNASGHWVVLSTIGLNPAGIPSFI